MSIRGMVVQAVPPPPFYKGPLIPLDADSAISGPKKVRSVDRALGHFASLASPSLGRP